MNISIKLKLLRESRGWTQNQAAEALGIACSTYRLYEKTGGRLPPAEVIAQICRVFSVSSDFLLDLSTEEQAQPLTVSEDLREPAGALMKEAAALCELENSRPYDRPALFVACQILQQIEKLLEGADARHAELLAVAPAYKDEKKPGKLPKDLRDLLLAQTVEGAVDEDLRQIAKAGAAYSEDVEKLAAEAVLNVSALIRSSLAEELGAASPSFTVPQIKK